MTENEPKELTETVKPTLIINKTIFNYLIQCSKWGKFLSIVGFVTLGILVVVGIGMMTMLSAFMPEQTNLPFNFAWFGLLYILMALLLYFPTMYLYRFSSRTKLALQKMDQESLESGFENLKSIFKFAGVYTMVFLGIYALIFAGTIIGTAIGSMM